MPRLKFYLILLLALFLSNLVASNAQPAQPVPATAVAAFQYRTTPDPEIHQRQPAPKAQRSVAQNDQKDPQLAAIQEEQVRKLRKERFNNLKANTAKLLELATELNATVEAANENMLSLEVVRKAEEVEKLAKKIKGSMKDGF